MKKTLLITLLALATLQSKSQTLVNKKDPFTGQTVKAGIVFLGSPTSGMQLMLTEDKGKKYIAFNWSAPSGQNGAFNNQKVEELSILLKMDNDSIFKFKADSVASRITNVGNTSMLIICSNITDDQINFLSKHQISILDSE